MSVPMKSVRPSSPFITSALGFGVVCIIYVWIHRYRTRVRNPRGAPYPPGPSPLPLIGNLLDVPKGDEVGAFAKWAKEYGDIVSLEMFGRPLIILNSAKWTAELLDRRSANYSDRIHLPMMHDLLGLGWFLPQAHYGDYWRRQRRLFHRALQPSAVKRYNELQYEETLMLLRLLLKTPEDFRAHIRYSVQSKMLRVAYGYRTSGPKDSLIELEEEGMGAAVNATAPGSFLVDLIPILKYVPEWVPGAGFRRKAREWQDMLRSLKDGPFLTVKREMNEGKAAYSFVQSLLENPTVESEHDVWEEDIKSAAAAVYGAGSDTTFASLYTFVLAMLLHPEVQKAAQSELDRVLGGDRLPTMEDRPNLPYIEATLKELMRWEPVAPIGVPHMITDDDFCDGYFLPAGSTVFGNTWAILHDDTLFPEPQVFDPKRFLTNDGKICDGPLDPAVFAFGYGRRICPGRHFADASVWIAMCSILTVFSITPAKDEHGNYVHVKPQFVSGVIRSPLPFQCTIKPRSDSLRHLII